LPDAASKPKLILLDEPTAGLTPLKRKPSDKLSAIQKTGITTLIVEHDIKFILSIAEKLLFSTMAKRFTMDLRQVFGESAGMSSLAEKRERNHAEHT
jgi:energy-coupling factor transporter ATP-binding protein EcfA2